MKQRLRVASAWILSCSIFLLGFTMPDGSVRAEESTGQAQLINVKQVYDRFPANFQNGIKDMIVLCEDNPNAFIFGKHIKVQKDNKDLVPVKNEKGLLIPIDILQGAEALGQIKTKDGKIEVTIDNGRGRLNGWEVYNNESGLIIITKASNFNNLLINKKLLEQLTKLLLLKYYVSPNGNDNGTGTISKPFATIEKARDTIRDKIIGGMDADITVFIRGGDYYLEAPLLFNQSDSGKNGYKVTYKNYQDEKPRIIAGKKITGWSKYQGNIFESYIGSGWSFNTLYENDLLAVQARSPNRTNVSFEGYAHVSKMSPTEIASKFIFAENAFPRIYDKRNLQTYLWPGGRQGHENWFGNMLNVRDMDYRTGTISLSRNVVNNMPIGAGSRFFLQGAFELLDSPGEFYLDKDRGKLYYYPMNPDIDKQDIIAPRFTNVMRLVGVSTNNLIENIRFEGLTFGFCDSLSEVVDNDTGAVSAVFSKNIEIYNCAVKNVGSNAIDFRRASFNNVIYGNQVMNVGRSGIYIRGMESYTQDISKNNVISNNYIYRVGKIIGHGSGIDLMYTNNNTVSYNRIKDGPRFGITLFGTMPSNQIGKMLGSEQVTESNFHLFDNNHDNVIEYNDISEVMNDSQDGGSIYSWGIGGGTILNNNYLHDYDIPISYAYGLYMDDCSPKFTITNNIISDIHRDDRIGKGKLSSPFQIKSLDQDINNNFIII